LFAPLLLRVLIVLCGAAVALHAWVGMRDILMDYVHATGLRLALYLAVIVILAGSVAWLVATLWSAA
jgi:succinate dehydrogenase / fumarate reductase membrane anchor subunit